MESHYFDKDYFIFVIIFNCCKVAAGKSCLPLCHGVRLAHCNLLEAASISATRPIIYIFFVLSNQCCRRRRAHDNPRAAGRYKTMAFSTTRSELPLRIFPQPRYRIERPASSASFCRNSLMVITRVA